ncbi:MAG: translesion DNA synthesis-associated protein ImuA [Pseudomonadota bacterium]
MSVKVLHDMQPELMPTIADGGHGSGHDGGHGRGGGGDGVDGGQSKAHIHSLLQKTGMWRASSLDCDYRQGIPTGFDTLDEKLAGQGWPADAITEFLLPRAGIGELRLLMPALSHLSKSESRWQVWVSPPHIPYAPALVQAGIRLDRQLIIKPRSAEDTLWVLSKALASGACSLVMSWAEHIRPEHIRRLQVACRDGQCAGVLFRSDQHTQTHSPAELRIRLQTTDRARGIHNPRNTHHTHHTHHTHSTHNSTHNSTHVSLHILKRRGGWAPPPFDVRLGDALRGKSDELHQLTVDRSSDYQLPVIDHLNTGMELTL